jgi:hypothetical protein
MWTPGYGYIWVSGYEWGYTPFQCGTWNYYDAFGWGWAPGLADAGPGGVAAVTESTWGCSRLDIVDRFARLGHCRDRPEVAAVLISLSP